MLPSTPDNSVEITLLTVLVLIVLLGAVLAWLLQRFNLPTFLAFILAGIILGPDALHLVKLEEIRVMAQVGVIFLMFIVGLDLSVDKLKRLRYRAPAAGMLQLGLTTLALTLVLRFATGLPWQLSFMLASMLALSSTAIVLKGLEDYREIDSDHGRLILGVLIMQDLSIIPLMALTTYLVRPLESSLIPDLAFVLLKTLIFGALAVTINLKLTPVFLDRLASTNRKEIFTLALVCIGLGMAVMSHYMGLSYEAGAFVAGLALSRSLFCRQVIADSKAFRDVFITLFFVSMGLLFDVDFLLRQPLLVIAATLLLILLKGAMAYISVKILGFAHKTALWAAVSLFQVGEFSFILLGRTLEMVSRTPGWREALALWSPVLVDAIVISMFLTPLVLQVFYRMSAAAPETEETSPPEPSPAHDARPAGGAPSRRVIIAGFGPTARNMTHALEAARIPYGIVETNLKTVRKLKSKGISCVYGDISRTEILETAGVRHSAVLAVTFPDPRTAEVAIREAKRLNPEIRCMVRSRYRLDVDRLYRMGVDDVIYEEFEVSVSFIFHVMRRLDYPILKTDRLIGMVRETENSLFQGPVSGEYPLLGRFSLLEGVRIEWISIGPDCPLIGMSLQQAELRRKTGVNIVSLLRSHSRVPVLPEPEIVLNRDDVLIGIGTPDQLRALESLLCDL